VTVFGFERCELDLGRVELRVGGQPRAVEPQVFDVLALLVRQRHRLVPKEELLDEVWHTRFVTESALSSRIKSARRAIGDDGRAQRLIRTVHGRGYQFVGEVREVAPDAPAATARATPVPRPATPTVGRDRDIDAVVALLDRSRIVTLLGPGGVGKTRLAVEAVLARDAAAPVECCFVDLTKVRAAELVPHLVVRELGIRGDAGSDAVAVIEEALRGRPFLLVLDNFEHVVEAAEFVADVVRAAPGLHVLVTSRARLRLVGEHVFDVSPLSVDARDGLGDAVALFAQAATAVDGTFRLEPNLADVVSICRTVDGLPLAIELAAGHVRTLPPSLLRTRLGARLGSPGAAARDAPARQQTVPATIDWSLQLLGSPEQRLFTRLGVFSGPVPLEAVEAVCGDHRLEVVEALSRLVDQSLVRRVPGRGGEARFVLLELLRERARELLVAADAGAVAGAVARRHADWVAAWVEDMEDRRWTDAVGWWVDALTELMSEIRAAHTWACEHGETEISTRIAAAMGNFWHRQGGQDEGRHWVGEALAAASDRDDLVGGRLHLSAGFVEWSRSQEVPRRHWEAAGETFRRLGHDRYVAYALNLTAASYLGHHAHYDQALALSAEAIALARQVGELPLVVAALNGRGELARVHGDDDLARAAYEEARELATGMGDDQHLAMLYGCLSFLADHAGDHAEARDLAVEALRLCWSAGRRTTAAQSLVQVAGPDLGLGHAARAAVLLGAAEEALQVLGGHIAQGDAPERDRLVGNLRVALGQEELDRLYAEGARLSLEAAVDLAMTPP
jgi:predicted ATPase/DNA-binding winged helix-turn-helix (wHTH) protein